MDRLHAILRQSKSILEKNVELRKSWGEWPTETNRKRARKPSENPIKAPKQNTPS